MTGVGNSSNTITIQEYYIVNSTLLTLTRSSISGSKGKLTLSIYLPVFVHGLISSPEDRGDITERNVWFSVYCKALQSRQSYHSQLC
jgi:hypothetical protein